MARRSSERFTTIRTEGGLLPADLLRRLVEGDRNLEGLGEAHYHLVDERLHEAIARSWARLAGLWSTFDAALVTVPAEDPAIGLTRERWLLPLFQELGYGRLLGVKAIDVDGKSYPVSHGWQHLPIHLVGWNVDLDTKTARVAGAARMSPHGLVQEVLNRSRSHLWGVVSNGRVLRLLRDSVSLTRQAYVEFDLRAMIDGEVYRDFVVLWCLLHQSRVEADRPEHCWIEQWAQEAHRQGTRMLEQLREGVQKAIETLGRGFLAHPTNEPLRDTLRAGRLDGLSYYRQLLRLVYRLLFLFVAEDRDLLLNPVASKEAHERYRRYYSTARLRELAGANRGTPHGDRWRSLALVITKLGDDAGCLDLGLPALGSFLWSPAATPDLNGRELSNRDLLAAIRALAYTENAHVRRPVDYRNLGPEELGSVYEALLELHPEINTESATFRLITAGGHERKTTGSYYTPRPLIQALLDSALEPVLDEAARAPDPETAILALKVCDPACGSGHFLIAAAHRIARRLAAARTGDEEPSPEALHHAVRDVIGRCIYGVDVNEMAVELCKVALWMDALEQGKPLSFLDHRISCGNSLLGTTPALLAEGIPDEAFEPLEGDDRAVVTALRKRNKHERLGQMQLPLVAEPGTPYGDLRAGFATLADVSDESITDLREKEEHFRGLMASSAYRHAKLLADAWCAAFVWNKSKTAQEAMTQDAFRQMETTPDRVPTALRQEVARLAEQYHFLHWHLTFPDVFRLPRRDEEPENEQAGWSGGFDLVIGNPPWERLKLQEKEWFAAKRPDIAEASNAGDRQRKIATLKMQDPVLHAAWLDASRRAEGESHLVRRSGRYPLCGRGDINTYSIFAETMRIILNRTGRVGCIVPTGIATDDTTRFFFQDLVESQTLVSLLGFENEEFIFDEVHNATKFCLLTMSGSSALQAASRFVFFARQVRDLVDEWRLFTLNSDDIAILNPNTRTCPIFRSKRDAELTKAIYRRVPVLIKQVPSEENPWGVRFATMFHMANDSALFRTRQQLERDGWVLQGNVFSRSEEMHLPLYEAKMVHHFNHRFGDYALKPDDYHKTDLPAPPVEALQDATYAPLPRYWVSANAVQERLAENWDQKWLWGWRDITNAVNERTVIAGAIPRAAVGHTMPYILFSAHTAALADCLQANLSAFVLDYSARQKVGGMHLTYGYLNQLPVLAPNTFTQPAPWGAGEAYCVWIRSRVLELNYTAWDLAAFARQCGYDGPPFRWNDERRFLLRCELDAAFFHLYGVGRDNADYIMDTFPLVRRDDDARHGEYRTKRIILDLYDALAASIATGNPYHTLLDPPPADPRVAHLPHTDRR